MSASADRLVSCVMAGGSGTRFWPLSRKQKPKQLLPFFGDGTLLQATLDRVAPICPSQRQMVVTAAGLVDAVRQFVAPDVHVIGEPMPRNTAPCMALAAMAAEQIAGPDAILALLPADHWVADADAFRRAMVAACAHADAGAIVTLGVRPTAPETGYGYIETGGTLGDGVRAVARFVEKPKLDRALEFLQTGKHFWNAGVFVARVDRAWQAIERHQPETAKHLGVLRNHAVGSAEWIARLALAFPQCPSISVDFGVMEHETGLRVVPLDAGWSDVGTWSSLLPLKRDGEANFVRGEVIAVDADGCVLVSDGPLLAVVGLRDVAVVATEDATLVLPLDRSQDVRVVVQALVADGRDKLL